MVPHFSLEAPWSASPLQVLTVGIFHKRIFSPPLCDLKVLSVWGYVVLQLASDAYPSDTSDAHWSILKPLCIMSGARVSV